MTAVNNKHVIKKWLQPRKSAFEWVQHGHQQYITARMLYWKKFEFQFALLGAHAIELYLKAFLIHKTGKYPHGHFLDAIYRECMKHDAFFHDESLSSRFLPEEAPKVLAPELWPNYVEPLRYPESIMEQPLPGFAVFSGGDTAGTCETLDRIAHFMHQTIPQPPYIIGRGSVIDEVLATRGYLYNLGQPENAPEIIDLFLRHNRYFTSPMP